MTSASVQINGRTYDLGEHPSPREANQARRFLAGCALLLALNNSDAAALPGPAPQTTEHNLHDRS